MIICSLDIYSLSHDKQSFFKEVAREPPHMMRFEKNSQFVTQAALTW